MLLTVRLNDVKLYKYALIETISTHFTTNHHNYSRWMLIYCLDLANLAKGDPNLGNTLANVGFIVNRAGKTFAGVPVDMTLKQTN